MDLLFVLRWYNILTSCAIGIIPILPMNQILAVRSVATLAIMKSFNFSDSSSVEKLHHLVSFLLCAIILTSINNIERQEDLDDYYASMQTNISTIFLNLRHYYKYTFIDALFILSFFYYRSVFFLHVLNGIPLIETVLCHEHPYVNKSVCVTLFDVSFKSLNAMNIYWSVLIIRKMLNKCKTNTLNKQSTHKA